MEEAPLHTWEVLASAFGADLGSRYHCRLLEQIVASDHLAFVLDAVNGGWFESATVSPATEERRARRVAAFEKWAEAHGLAPLPADPETVELYATHRHDAGVKWGTIKEELNAIDWHHERHGFPKPGKTARVVEFRKGLVRSSPEPDKQAYPLTIADLKAMVTAIKAGALDFQRARPGRTHLGRLRAEAFLLVTFGSACRPSDLLVTEASWFVPHSDWVAIEVPRSKNRVNGVQYRMYPAEDPRVCPVFALSRWLEVAINSGGLPNNRVFSRVRALGDPPLVDPFHGLTGTDLAAKIAQATGCEAATLRTVAERAGVTWNPDRQVLGTRSTRRGVVTEAHRAGAAIEHLQRTLGHSMFQTTRRYVDAGPSEAIERLIG